uniref:Uncharacterized protein n=1 Tax=Zea mays TaxID=4577 RepID=C4J2F5_MAIZE|nr:unknown [Zea mays]
METMQGTRHVFMHSYDNYMYKHGTWTHYFQPLLNALRVLPPTFKRHSATRLPSRLS